MRSKLPLIILLMFLLLTLTATPVSSQSASGRALDLMLVIDNSCSMFPRDQILPGCQTFGSDPDFLRITGADLFMARLGFADANAENYNLGVVGLGDDPQLLVPLQQLDGARDHIAQAIANPLPQSATKLIPAVRMAYQELATSANRRPDNLQAVVVLTDGIPWPQENQTDADIEKLVDDHANIPLFVMLLQSGEKEFETYNRFWEQLQTTRDNVYIFRIADASQIEKTYNGIVAKIQNTIPAEGQIVTPDQPYSFFVSEDVQRIIVTVVHPLENPESQVVIQDPDGKTVDAGQPGVNQFRGLVNPVEVISIFQPRLSESLKERMWTISSNTEVSVFLDRQGAYRVQFLSPSVSVTNFSDTYLATGFFASEKDFEVKFNLLTTDGQVKMEPQIVRGKLILPDGQENTLTNTGSMSPDFNGVYTVKLNPSLEYPEVSNQPGRFAIVLQVGSADAPEAGTVPVSVARLLVEFGLGPSIATVEPLSVACSENQSSPIGLTLENVDTVVPGSLSVRVFGSKSEVALLVDSTNPERFSGDLQELCQSSIQKLSCGISSNGNFKIRVSAELLSTSRLINVERDLPVTLTGPACPPAPTATPSPTPLPNCDGDVYPDVEDQCPCQSGFSQFDGCPPPMWLLVLSGVLAVGALVFLIWLFPSIRILVSPPPKAFMLACIPGDRFSSAKSTYSIGMQYRVSEIKIGGNPKECQFVVKGLRPVEFVVQKSGDKVHVLAFDLTTKKATVRLIVTDIPATIPTSVSGISLKFSLRRDNLEC